MQQDLWGITHFQLTPRLLTHRFQRWAQELGLFKATFHLTAGNLALFIDWHSGKGRLDSWISAPGKFESLFYCSIMGLSGCPVRGEGSGKGTFRIKHWSGNGPEYGPRSQTSVLMNCVTFDKQLKLVYLSLLICQMGTIVITFPDVVTRIMKISAWKASKTVPGMEGLSAKENNILIWVIMFFIT